MWAADMCVGSLIKNPGGGLAPSGGYIAGRKDCVERAAYRLTAPGLGKELGANLGVNRSLYRPFPGTSGNGFCTEISYFCSQYLRKTWI